MMNYNFLSATPMFNGGGGPSPWGGHMMNTPFGGLFMILLLVCLVGFVFMMMRGGRNKNSHEETPMDILKRRYASGEIDKDQFEKMKHDIEK